MSWHQKTIDKFINAAKNLCLDAVLLAESDNDRACARRTVRVYVKSFDVHVCEHQDGMTIDEIKRKMLNPIIEHLKKEEGKIKMTRQDAINKIMANGFPAYPFKAADLITALEALGLIKFDDESSLICGVPTSVLIETLKNNGYTVIKNA